MKQQLPPGVPLAVVIFAVATSVALRAARGRPAMTACPPDLAGHGMATLPGTPGGGPVSSLEQMQYVFHELHADGRHALCAVCDGQYRPPAGSLA